MVTWNNIMTVTEFEAWIRHHSRSQKDCAQQVLEAGNSISILQMKTKLSKVEQLAQGPLLGAENQNSIPDQSFIKAPACSMHYFFNSFKNWLSSLSYKNSKDIVMIINKLLGWTTWNWWYLAIFDLQNWEFHTVWLSKSIYRYFGGCLEKQCEFLKKFHTQQEG